MHIFFFPLFFLFPLLLAIVFVRIVLRLLGFGLFRRRPYYPYNGGYGYRRHRLGRGLFSILALLALDRLFTRRF